MEENIFLVKWYGPFASPEDEKTWEKGQDFKCSLYLLHGMLKGAKTAETYYCGMSTRAVYERLRDKGHHLAEVKNRLNSIYVGTIANVQDLTRRQICVVEKLITAYLAWELGEKRILNETNFHFPSENVYIINEWYKHYDVDKLWERQPINAPSHIVPDVIASHLREDGYIDLYGSKKLKKL